MRSVAFCALLSVVCGAAWGQQIPGQPPGEIQIPPPTEVAPWIPFPHLPAPKLDEANNGIGVAQSLTRSRKAQARIIWVDATANLTRMNSAEKVAAIIDRVKRSGFNIIVLDVKPIVGFTIYPSKFAPKLTEWLDRSMPADFDALGEFVKQAKAAGLQVFASMNVFSEGHRNLKKGLGYDNPAWQTTLYEPQAALRAGAATFNVMDRPNIAPRTESELAVYSDLTTLRPTAGSVVAVLTTDARVAAVLQGEQFAPLDPTLPKDGGAVLGIGQGADFLRSNVRVGEALAFETTPAFVPISQRPEQQVPLMVNPHNPELQRRILNMVEEVVRNYAVDGVIFDDRLRYAGINADFSYETRKLFEQYVGKELRWPEDVFKFEVNFPLLTRRVVPGPYFDAWLLWRSMTLRNWLARSVSLVKGIRPSAQVAVYAGSWYGEYPTFGSNWAADDFTAGFHFLTPSYQKTGFAGLLDWLTTGAYYPSPTIADAIAAGRIPGASIEAAGQLSNRAVNDQTWIYCGIMISDYSGRPEALKAALQAAAATTQGIMVFDYSHFDLPRTGNEQFWEVFEQAFKDPAIPPHSIPGLLAQVRKEKTRRRAAGLKDPPVIIHPGIPGTGF